MCRSRRGKQEAAGSGVLTVGLHTDVHDLLGRVRDAVANKSGLGILADDVPECVCEWNVYVSGMGCGCKHVRVRVGERVARAECVDVSASSHTKAGLCTYLTRAHESAPRMNIVHPESWIWSALQRFAIFQTGRGRWAERKTRVYQT